MNKIKNIILLFPLIFLLGGCSTLGITRTKVVKQKEGLIATLEAEKADLQKKLQEKIDQKNVEIKKSEDNRISVGGAQSIAALGSLKADPNKTKYTNAAIPALEVTENSLIDKVEPKDLIAAIQTQRLLLSELAEEVVKGKKEISALNNEITAAKSNEAVLKKEKEEVEKKKQEAVLAKEQEISKTKKELDEIKDKIAAKNSADAEKYREDNAWHNKINPFKDLFSGVKKIIGWVIFFVIFGAILKLASILFPGVNVIQVFVGGFGRIFGGVIKLVFGWIPDVLHGMSAVDKKEHEIVDKTLENSLGAIQELRNEKPEVYEKDVKGKLKEWNGDDPKIDALVEKKLKKLNLK